MQIKIDQQTINLEPATAKQEITRIQQSTLEVVIEVAKTCNSISSKALCDRLGLRSSLPLWSRLKHLQEKGWIQQLEVTP